MYTEQVRGAQAFPKISQIANTFFKYRIRTLLLRITTKIEILYQNTKIEICSNKALPKFNFWARPCVDQKKIM